MHDSGASRRGVAKSCSPSLRANGSCECAPDDRLREAIHSFFTRQDGLLRFARNDGLKTGALNLQPSHPPRIAQRKRPHTPDVLARDQAVDDRRLGASTGSQVVVKRSTPSDSSAVKRPSTSM